MDRTSRQRDEAIRRKRELAQLIEQADTGGQAQEMICAQIDALEPGQQTEQLVYNVSHMGMVCCVCVRDSVGLGCVGCAPSTNVATECVKLNSLFSLLACVCVSRGQ